MTTQWRYLLEKPCKMAYQNENVLEKQEMGRPRNPVERLTASESLENGLLDDTVVVNLDLQLHYVATCRCAYETGSDIEIFLVE